MPTQETFNSYQVQQPSVNDAASVPYSMAQSVANRHQVSRLSVDGASETLDVSSNSSSDPIYNEAHPFATARGSMGALPLDQFTDSTLIKFAGQEAPIKVWEQIGYVMKDKAGNYQLTQNGEKVATVGYQAGDDNIPKPPNSEEDAPEWDSHPTEIEEAFSKAIEPIPQPMWDKAVIEFANELDMSKVDLDAIAHNSGLSTDEVKSRAKFVENIFSNQVMTALGDDAQEVMDWARANRLEELKDATRSLVGQRSLQGFKALAKEWSQDCSTETQQIKAANKLHKMGYAVRKGSDGNYLINTDRGETTIPVAFKNGWLKWTGRKH